ncbi:MAG: hypothetical protein KZQ65_12200, partial [Candidatus Thiodiazotropha sp. (ex Gloverina cf. vestifex)]|nr:hypothetical protein [Candidatus Thiodiazotropha sp. (ex Gloverina cf. vestifex)]
TVTITAIQPRLRLSGTNRLGFQPSMAISGRPRSWVRIKPHSIHPPSALLDMTPERVTVIMSRCYQEQPRGYRKWHRRGYS